MKIMLVDDSKTMRNIQKAVLAQLNKTITAVHSIVGDEETRAALKGTVTNAQEVTASLKALLDTTTAVIRVCVFGVCLTLQARRIAALCVAFLALRAFLDVTHSTQVFHRRLHGFVILGLDDFAGLVLLAVGALGDRHLLQFLKHL